MASSSCTVDNSETMDIEKLTQNTLRVVLGAIGKSNDLLSGGKDFDFYNSFKGFRSFMKTKSTEITNLMSQILSQQEIKCRLDGLDSEELFDAIVEANDLILEKVGTSLDDASGINKTQAPILIASATSKTEINTSWNRKGTPTSTRTYRLLTAHNILRPQLKFIEQIDNSSNIFVPKIKEKPNSIKPLAIIIEQTEYGEMFSHPYQCELDHFNPPASQLQKVELQEAPAYVDTEFIFVNSVELINALVADLKKQTEIAVDLEHHSYRSFQGITCLMQISTRKTDYIIDTLQLWNDLQILNEVFTDPKIVKVFHGADLDIEWLQRDLGIYVVNMFDTGQASRVLNFAHYSLAFLLKHYCKIDADKQYQLADWRIRPLPEEMTRYAREDTHYLLYIYDKMKNELISKGNQSNNLLLSVFNKSASVCAKRYEKPIFRPDGYLDLCRKYGKTFNTRQLYALRDIYSWRDKVARIEDESLGYVLPNHMLMQIVEVLPREMQGILSCCNPIPSLVRQYLNELHQIILKAREQSLITPIVQHLQIQVDESRRDIDLDNVLLCPHDYSHLEETGAIDTGPTMLDLWNKHGDNLEKELQSLNISIPKKSTPDLTALANMDKIEKNTNKKVNKALSSLSGYLSHFARHKLSCLPENPPDDDKVTAANDVESDENRIKKVEAHFTNLIESFKKNPQEVEQKFEVAAISEPKNLVESVKNSQEARKEPEVASPNEVKKIKTRKRKRKNKKNIVDGTTPLRNSIKKPKKRINKSNDNKGSVADKILPMKKKFKVDEANFKPFNYNDNNESKLNKRIKREPHDPTVSTVSYKTGRSSRTRLKGKSKSFTFATRNKEGKHKQNS